ncbi:MAG TPA: RNA polymerase sigma factor [Kofleriaceae bacterium]
MRDESEIHAAWMRGDMTGASSQLLTTLGPEILGYLVGMHGDLDKANDVFSAFCERIWREMPDFQWRCSARTWAYVIVRRISIDHARSESRRTRRIQPISQLSGWSEIAAQVRTQTMPFLQTGARDALRALRDRLPPEDRMLLVLRVDRELSWSDLAHVFLGDAAGDAARRKQEAARLRKRFQLVKDRLRRWMIEGGLLPPDDA